MTEQANTRARSPIPNRGQAAYIAGRLIHAHGDQSVRQLFALVDFGPKPHLRRATLDRAIESGWLVRQPSGMVGIGEFARWHYDDAEKPAQRDGQVAAPRSVDLMNRAPYRSNLNPRGTRADIPAWSQRSGASFNTKA